MRALKIRPYLWLAVFAMVLGACSLVLLGHQVWADKQKLSIPTPTIFLPGTNGTNHRFDDLIDRLKELGVASPEVLKVYVKANGEIKLSGSFGDQDKQPLIVVGYEENGEDAVDEQGKLFQHVLLKLAEDYQFSRYQVVGHSNGGLAITSYLENYRQTSDPFLSKLVTLGTPFNGVVETDQQSRELQDILSRAEQLPKLASVLTIAGNLENEGDGVVPLSSVRQAAAIFEKTADYQTLIVTGKNAGHSDLVTNSEVVKKLRQYLF